MKRIISFTLVAALAVSLAFGAAVSHAGRPSLVPKAHVGHQPQARHTLTDLDMLATLFSGALTVNNEALAGPSTQDDDEPAQINFVQGKIAFEFVGQATNFAPTPSAPLGSAHQYGFLTAVRGIDNVFTGSPHNETTAVLTFFNEATTAESFTDGPLRIVDRNGTTTVYLATAPASFADPDSFRSGNRDGPIECNAAAKRPFWWVRCRRRRRIADVQQLNGRRGDRSGQKIPFRYAGRERLHHYRPPIDGQSGERRDKPACCRGCKSPTGKEVANPS